MGNRGKTFSRDEIDNLMVDRPHVVLLGAGASRAALPCGDKNGKAIPIMKDLVKVVHLEPELQKLGIDYQGRDFEQIYSELSEIESYRVPLQMIERQIYDYFASLELPNTPTIYDHLILSLRKKDKIAIFNWDPLLYQAWRRNYGKANLPNILFLHGNVMIGVCLEDKCKGMIGERCRKCGRPFKPSRLFYPIKRKNYASDPFIINEWETLKRALANSYILTIFGYNAPDSDADAVALLKEGWGDPKKRSVEEIEIIDLKEKEELHAKWKDFIYHYQTMKSFYNSWIARHPRRSCDAMWNILEELKEPKDHSVPIDAGFDELWEWYKPLVDAERSVA